jgi:hypothetical protein
MHENEASIYNDCLLHQSKTTNATTTKQLLKQRAKHHEHLLHQKEHENY